MIKRLSQCIREYKKDAILSPVYVLVESLLDVAIPFVMADLIDKGIDAGNMGMILRYGAILVGFALVALLFIGGTQLRPGHGGLCPQPAARYVSSSAGLFLFQYRQIFGARAGHPPDDRCK